MGERAASRRTFLHVSMRPVGERDTILSSTGAWAVFGWVMITLGVTFVVLVIVFMIAFFGQPGAGV